MFFKFYLDFIHNILVNGLKGWNVTIWYDSFSITAYGISKLQEKWLTTDYSLQPNRYSAVEIVQKILFMLAK